MVRALGLVVLLITVGAAPAQAGPVSWVKKQIAAKQHNRVLDAEIQSNPQLRSFHARSYATRLSAKERSWEGVQGTSVAGSGLFSLASGTVVSLVAGPEAGRYALVGGAFLGYRFTKAVSSVFAKRAARKEARDAAVDYAGTHDIELSAPR